MTQQTIDSAPPITDEAPEPTRVAPMCACGAPPAAFVAEPEAASPPAPEAAPSRAPHKVVARLWLRLPLWARVTGGVALWAVFYHYWLPIATWLTQDVLALDDGRFGSSLEFFIYYTVKVLMLLTMVVFGVGVVRTFFSPQRTRALLHGRREATGNVMAASLGIVTPFCSCSAVPLFIGFVEAGIPLGVTFSFLIAAPMVNEVALVLLYGLFGWAVATLYLVTGLLIAMIAGWVIGRLRMDRYVEDWVREIRMGDAGDGEDLDWAARMSYAWQAVRDIVGKVWPYVVAGIAVGAAIHRYVPENFVAGIIPVVEALLEKGAALGTVLAFMMAVIALSLPETIILRKVLKWPLIFTFLGVVGVGIVFVGYLFNLVLWEARAWTH